MWCLDDQATREKAGEVEDVYEYCIGPDCVALEEGGMCNGHISRTFLKECNEQCGCRPNCTNRVVQRGLTRRLQVRTRVGQKWNEMKCGIQIESGILHAEVNATRHFMPYLSNAGYASISHVHVP